MSIAGLYYAQLFSRRWRIFCGKHAGLLFATVEQNIPLAFSLFCSHYTPSSKDSNVFVLLDVRSWRIVCDARFGLFLATAQQNTAFVFSPCRRHHTAS